MKDEERMMEIMMMAAVRRIKAFSADPMIRTDRCSEKR